jgi:small neutral amino acid transporter SnatA (MarC family)
MDFVHLHLLVVHLPIFALALGIFVLKFGYWRKSTDTLRAAFLLFVIAAAGGGVASFSGEEAEDRVENLAGVSEHSIEAHEEAAELAMPLLIGTGVLALAALAVSIWWERRTRLMAWIVGFAAFAALVAVSRTAWFGGKIRHTEIAIALPVAGPQASPEIILTS